MIWWLGTRGPSAEQARRHHALTWNSKTLNDLCPALSLRDLSYTSTQRSISYTSTQRCLSYTSTQRSVLHFHSKISVLAALTPLQVYILHFCCACTVIIFQSVSHQVVWTMVRVTVIKIPVYRMACTQSGLYVVWLSAGQYCFRSTSPDCGWLARPSRNLYLPTLALLLSKIQYRTTPYGIRKQHLQQHQQQHQSATWHVATAPPSEANVRYLVKEFLQ